MSLWLVRHARPLVAPGVCYGALDIPADPVHTQQVAQQLARILPEGMALHSSPLRRCQQLTVALTQQRPDLSVTTDARLAEMDFGTWEGRPWDAIGAAALDAWTADFPTHRPGGGESVQAFLDRVNAAWQERRGVDQPMVWITHAGVIRAVSLLASGTGQVSRADQWPKDAPSYGEWLTRQ